LTLLTEIFHESATTVAFSIVMKTICNAQILSRAGFFGSGLVRP